MKNGFATLNRLLGKKSKSSTNLSKSTSTLNVAASTINIDDSSQMKPNRITPLPVATSNAPFEQTFRITVLLPKDQLYVARLGARVLLHKLLDLVCENKQLDPEKYEFRHPADPSQVFSCDLTIGAVGLSEIRLCHKSEAYDTFNADEIIKLHRTTAGRDSMSSSEFSSRNSKHTIKTPSPYSSSNSLNSMDSTGMNSSYRQSMPKMFAQSTIPPVAPTRKKRTAPKPPSQNSIPEKDVPQTLSNVTPTCANTDQRNGVQVNGLRPLPRKEFHVSTPNLSQMQEQNALSAKDFHKSNISVDCNGNTRSSPNNNSPLGQTNFTLRNKEIEPRRPVSMRVPAQDSQISPCNGNIPVENGHDKVTMPEPSPRKKVTKSKKAAPSPPTRSLCSPTEIIQESPQKLEIEESHSSEATNTPRPVALPRSCANHSTPDPSIPQITNNDNVSKTILNRSSTPDPALTPENPDISTTTSIDDGFDTQSKQADSGIGEALPPSPMLSSVQSSPTQCKSPFESSSDDDEMIKVYNLKLGKTIVKTLSDHKTFEDLTVLSTDESEVADHGRAPPETCSIKSEATSWSNFTIPAPPNFADSSTNEAPSDIPITPIIKERPSLDFSSLTSEQMAASLTDNSEHTAINSTENDRLVQSNNSKEELPPKHTQSENHAAVEEDPVEKSPSEDQRTVQELQVKKSISQNQNNVEKPQVKKSCSENLETVEEFPIKKLLSEVNAIIENEKQSTEQRGPKNPEPQLNGFSTVHCDADLTTKTPIETTSVEPTLSDVDGLGEQEAKVINEMDSIINSIETIIQQKPLLSTLDRLGISEEEEENLKETKTYKKRCTITLNTTNNILKHRRSITRSDSFHSTRQQEKESETPETSEETLTTRSSSFLSLAKFNSDNQHSPPVEENLSQRRSSSELSIGESPSLQSLEVMKSILNSRKSSMSSQSSTEEQRQPASSCDTENTTEQPSPKNNILRTQIVKQSEEKVYRYSGPPSINFSTWNERPKIQVAIKNEGDYIFGGKIGGHNATTTATVNLVQQKNFRNSTPDPTGNRLPFVRSVEYKKTTSVAMTPLKENNSSSSVTIDPVTLPTTPQRFSPSPPETMPKPKFILGGRMSNPTPVIKGFTQPQNSGPRSITNGTVTLLRSTSVSQADIKPKSTLENATPVTFGQETLRKTGLKEKILANTECDAVKAPPAVLKTPESAKIELKITRTLNSEKRNTFPIHESAKTVTPLAPPPPPIIRAVVTKQNSIGAASTLIQVDPRDQLLSAIRNFKRDELKRI